MNTLGDNKYKKWYTSIIENRINNIPTGYSENHHIIPKSVGGSDDKSNLVLLATREHFIVHALLAKMYKKDSYKWHKMNHAFMMMKCTSFCNKDRYFNSRIYSYLKGNFSIVMSKAQSGKRNSNYGKMWICNLKTKKNAKILKTDPIPSGWIKGRNKWNAKPTMILNERCCTFCNNKFNPKRQKSRFCSVACENRWHYENAKMVTIIKDNVKKTIKDQDFFSYNKIGWIKI